MFFILFNWQLLSKPGNTREVKSRWDFNRHSECPTFSSALGNHINLFIYSAPLHTQYFSPIALPEKLISCYCSWPKQQSSHHLLSQLILEAKNFCNKGFIPDACSVFSTSQFHPSFPWTTLKRFLSFPAFSLYYPRRPLQGSQCFPQSYLPF